MKTFILFRNIALFLLFLCPFSVFATETVTLNSYLPSPQANVQTIVLNPHTESTTSGCTAGRVYINSSGDLQICQSNSGSTNYFYPTGAWRNTNNYIYPTATATNSSLAIGIGTSTPSVKLHVQSPSAATTAVMRLQNTTGDFDTFVTNTTPQSAITGNAGDMAVDATNGNLYIKTSNSSNTGWNLVGGATSAYASVFINSATTGSYWGEANTTYYDKNLFQSSNYTTLSTTANVTASNITYTSANGRFTVSQTGIYLINLNLIFEPWNQLNGPTYEIRIKKNGTTVYSQPRRYDADGSNYQQDNSVATILSLTANDYLEFTFYYYSDFGGGITITPGTMATIAKLN